MEKQTLSLECHGYVATELLAAHEILSLALDNDETKPIAVSEFAQDVLPLLFRSLVARVPSVLAQIGDEESRRNTCDELRALARVLDDYTSVQENTPSGANGTDTGDDEENAPATAQDTSSEWLEQ